MENIDFFGFNESNTLEEIKKAFEILRKEDYENIFAKIASLGDSDYYKSKYCSFIKMLISDDKIEGLTKRYSFEINSAALKGYDFSKPLAEIDKTSFQRFDKQRLDKLMHRVFSNKDFNKQRYSLTYSRIGINQAKIIERIKNLVCNNTYISFLKFLNRKYKLDIKEKELDNKEWVLMACSYDLSKENDKEDKDVNYAGCLVKFEGATINYVGVFGDKVGLDWAEQYMDNDLLSINDKISPNNHKSIVVLNISEIQFDQKHALSTKYKYINDENDIKIKSDKLEELAKNFILGELSFLNKASGNYIISGPPGSGKSRFVNKYIVPGIVQTSENQNEDDFSNLYERCIFSKAFFYEDMWGCLKPDTVVNQKKTTKDIVYRYVPGPLARILKKALYNPGQNYVFIIEELNRGDAFSIMRELYLLMERNENGESKYWVNIPEELVEYLSQSDNDDIKYILSEFLKYNDRMLKLPPNLFVIGTVNNADSGVSYIDIALKRRFKQIVIDEDGVVYGAKELVESLKNRYKILELDECHNRLEKICESAEIMNETNGNDSRDEIKVLTKDLNCDKPIDDIIKDINEKIKSSNPDKLLSSYDKEYNSRYIEILSHITQNVYGQNTNEVLKDEYCTVIKCLHVLYGEKNYEDLFKIGD